MIDIECNALDDPDQIWLIVCKDIDTGALHIFRNVTQDQKEKERFYEFVRRVNCWVGHNVLGYDLPILHKLLGVDIRDVVYDTLIISKLVDYSRDGGHSVEQYGVEFGIPKQHNHYVNFFTKWSQELEDYCVRDVEITHRIFDKYHRIISNPDWDKAIRLEHDFQRVVNSLHTNGFGFNTQRAQNLLEKVTEELKELDHEILRAFPARTELVREYTPKLTKHGTLSRVSVPRSLGADLSQYSEGASFSLIRWKEFNPSSHKQIIGVLDGAGWRPVDKTATHIEAERTGDGQKLIELRKTGWKINENNLSTLPEKAPKPARLLAKRILLESRRRTLTEWLGLVQPDDRIHGKFYGIGAWTHRMAHQQPNTANIPNEFELSGKRKLLGKEMRQLWRAPRNRLLVGVDAEGIQLRVFAHYINDAEFTEALVKGRKDDKTDPHSLNQRILGHHCKSRASAKRFIYALLLGAGLGKLSEILECSRTETQQALDRLLERYAGFAQIKKEVIPRDAKRGYFIGLDGRKLVLPGETGSERRHLCMSGYLQNGEAVIMKLATLKWWQRLEDYDAQLVNFVHDEWQVECPNDVKVGLEIAAMMADSLREVGEDLKLKCPLAGSFWNDDHKDYTIGSNWYQTH